MCTDLSPSGVAHECLMALLRHPQVSTGHVPANPEVRIGLSTYKDKGFYTNIKSCWIQWRPRKSMWEMMWLCSSRSMENVIPYCLMRESNQWRSPQEPSNIGAPHPTAPARRTPSTAASQSEIKPLKPHWPLLNNGCLSPGLEKFLVLHFCVLGCEEKKKSQEVATLRNNPRKLKQGKVRKRLKIKRMEHSLKILTS